MVRALLVALSGLVAPGFAQGLMRQRRPQWIAFGAMVAAILLMTLSVWAMPLVVAVYLGTMVDAFLRYRRLRPKIHWSWLDPLLAFLASLVLQMGLRTMIVEAFKAPSSSMNPTIQIGDHFLINKLARSPDHGDIVIFRHPCTPERDYLKRVIALGGETLEIRCSLVYVNGKPVPRALVDADCTYQDYDERNQQWFSRECSRYRETLGSTSYDIFHEREEPGRTDRHADSKDFPQINLQSCADDESTNHPVDNQPMGSIVETGPMPTEEADPCKPHRHFVVPEGTVFVMGDNRANSNDSRYWGVVPVENIRGKVTGIWLPFSRFGAVH